MFIRVCGVADWIKWRSKYGHQHGESIPRPTVSSYLSPKLTNSTHKPETLTP